MTEDENHPFSRRHGYRPDTAEITVRNDAPEEVRFAVLEIAHGLNIKPSWLREVVCGVLLTPPNSDNLSEYPNIWSEVNTLIEECDWFKVYDIAEAIYRNLSSHPSAFANQYEERLNDLFRERGIGWQMTSGKFLVRGSETFSTVTQEAARVLADHNRQTAAGEIHEALNDLSRRPNPDVSGAIQHAMAALECVARDITGEQNQTLGAIINQHAAMMGIQPPLDQALHKLWGYASQKGRHLQEGKASKFEDAELVVSIAAAVSTYLSKSHRNSDS